MSMRINPSRLYYHISGNLQGGISKLMAIHVCWSFGSRASSSHCSSDLERSVSRRRWSSSLCTAALGAGARWMLWSENVGPEMVDLSLFPDFVNEMRWILVQSNTGTSPGRRAISICVLLLAACPLIDSRRLVSDGASLDLTMVDAWHIFQQASRRR
jgi:hypothetical protein